MLFFTPCLCQCWNPVFVFAENQIPHGFPTIDMGPQLKVVEKTRTATMLCAASGNPDPEISWFKDMLPVDISSSNGRIKQLRSGALSFNLLQLLKKLLVWNMKCQQPWVMLDTGMMLKHKRPLLWTYDFMYSISSEDMKALFLMSLSLWWLGLQDFIPYNSCSHLESHTEIGMELFPRLCNFYQWYMSL